MSSGVYGWWIFLCAVAIANVTAWSMASNALDRRGCTLPADIYHARRWQIILAAGYVFGCAYRSVLPVFDVPRICLFDTWFSSAIVGRSVATFAELCFAAQWALLMRELSLASGSRFGKVVANSIVPLIAVAETFSWHAVLTTANAGHVVEETLWGVGATLVLAGLLTKRPVLGGVSLSLDGPAKLAARWQLVQFSATVVIFLVSATLWVLWIYFSSKAI